MASKYIASIPLSSIDHIQLYVNSGKKSLSAIMALTGADYGLNGGIFQFGTLKQYGNVKSGGKVYNNAGYTEFGLCWNTNDIKMAILPTEASSYENYLGCVGMIYKSEPITMYFNSDMGGTRGRSAMGIKDNNLVLYCSKDGSSYARTPHKLQSELVSYGCSGAIMLDGGGSSQCNFKGSTIYSSRVVANVILVYLKKTTTDTTTPTTPTTSETNYVKQFQTWMNNNYGMGLSVDGSYGPASKKAAIKCYQTIMNKEHGKNLTVDGSFGPASKAAAITLNRGKTGNLVKLAQGVLYGRGYDPNGFDRSFGPGMEKAVIAFQKAVSLSQTGKITQAVWNKLMN